MSAPASGVTASRSTPLASMATFPTSRVRRTSAPFAATPITSASAEPLNRTRSDPLPPATRSEPFVVMLSFPRPPFRVSRARPALRRSFPAPPSRVVRSVRAKLPLRSFTRRVSLPPAPLTTMRLNERRLKAKSAEPLLRTSTSSLPRARRFSRRVTEFALRLPVIRRVPRLISAFTPCLALALESALLLESADVPACDGTAIAAAPSRPSADQRASSMALNLHRRTVVPPAADSGSPPTMVIWRLLLVVAIAIVLFDPQAALAEEQKQPTAVGSGGAAATVDLAGTQAAIRTLRQGGNAVDAAVAAAGRARRDRALLLRHRGRRVHGDPHRRRAR